MTSSVNGQDRLQKNLRDIWNSWGLDPDQVGGPTSDVLDQAVVVVESWLQEGIQEPAIAIRAIQMLLADLEKPDIRRRECWAAVRDTLRQKQVWKNAGNSNDHLLYLQALLLAAWPRGDEEGFLAAKSLFDSAWTIRRESPTRTEFRVWVQAATSNPAQLKASWSGALPTFASEQPLLELNVSDALRHIDDNKGHGHIAQIGPQLVRVLKAHSEALAILAGDPIPATNGETGKMAALPNQVIADIVRLHVVKKNDWDQWVHHVESTAKSSNSRIDLLWWGQSRYCRALQKPYLRMKSEPAALLWWTAREAAELATSVEVEPAAAYLVETLHNLDQNIDEEKSVLDWMEELYTTLNAVRSNVPRLSKRLDDIAKLDALGLPVTWVRRRVMDKERFDRDAAKNDVALHLDEKIDRGDWASWVFRETLLDLHLLDQGSA